ncbi:MAG TPA: carbohydrate kinase family protein, partial [Pyrinomonadaceae bacterium]
DAPAEFGSLGRVLHLDAHDPPACVRVAQAAKASGTIVSADIDNVYEGLPELLPLIDILIGSKEFPRRVTGIADERAALIELHRRFGCAIAGMTIGAAGAVVYCDGEFIESPGFRAPGGCRDTTGAGDAFHAGFLYGFLTHQDLETSLKFGNAVAAMKCSALGARTALPTEAELTNFLNNPC